MTISNQTNRTSAVGTNTVGQVVPFSFPINDTTDIVVTQRVTATGVESTLLETTNYTVSITGDIGGSITMVTVVAATAEIHIERDTPNTQQLDLEAGGAFNAENVEDGLDKNTKLTVENSDGLTRALRAPATDATTLDMKLPNSIDRASQFLSFDANGEPVVVSSVAPATATITAFMETLLDDANAAAGRTTLDAQQLSTILTTIAGLIATDGNLMEADGSTWTSISKSDLFAGLVDEILSYDGDVLTYDGDVLTYS